MLATAGKNATDTKCCSVITCLAIGMFLFSNAAYAAHWTPMGAVLCYIAGFMYGNLGRGLATLAIIVVGVGATLGKVSWGLAITVAVGISVMGSADKLVNALTGNAFEAC